MTGGSEAFVLKGVCKHLQSGVLVRKGRKLRPRGVASSLLHAPQRQTPPQHPNTQHPTSNIQFASDVAGLQRERLAFKRNASKPKLVRSSNGQNDCRSKLPRIHPHEEASKLPLTLTTADGVGFACTPKGESRYILASRVTKPIKTFRGNVSSRAADPPSPCLLQ